MKDEVEDCMALLICTLSLPFYPIGILIEHLTGKELYHRGSYEPIGDDCYNENE